MKSKFNVGDVVANRRTKWVGIVIDTLGDGDVRTDADGVVSEKELDVYDPQRHRSYHIALSTRKQMGEHKMNKRKVDLLSLYERAGDMFNKEFEYSKEERNAFMEAVKSYERFGQTIYGSKQLAQAVKEISELVELANSFTLKETDGWFDNVTATRHTKQMKEAVKVLQKEAQEIINRQQRLEAAYEDIGQLLGRYYDV